MANIYVRKSGSDANDGSTPALAKLTIAGAISAMNSDDIIWVGSGIYREHELLTGNKTVHIYGDETGENTGDAGEVIWSGLTDADDDTYADYQSAIRSDGTGYGIDIQNIIFQNWRLRYACGLIDKKVYGDITLKNIKTYNTFCLSGDNVLSLLDYVHTTADTAETIIIENIDINGVVLNGAQLQGCIRVNTASTSNNSLKMNNIIIDCAENLADGYSFYGIYLNFNGTIIDRLENFDIKIRATVAYGIYITSATAKDIYNSYISFNGSNSGSRGINIVTATGSYAYNCSIIKQNLGISYGNITESNCVNKVNYYITIINNISKYSPLKGVGNTSFPATDIKGNPRPAYGNGTACDIGAIESTSDIIQKEIIIKDSGDYSIKVSPCNYFKKTFQVPVTASELKTVKVKIRIDGTWGTYLPRVSLSGQGMTLSQSTKNSTTGSFEELTVSGTPTTTGIALLTIEAHSPNTDAAFYIDTITIE